MINAHYKALILTIEEFNKSMKRFIASVIEYRLIRFSPLTKFLIVFLLFFAPVMDVLITEEAYKTLGKETFLQLETNSLKEKVVEDIEDGVLWHWVVYSWVLSIFPIVAFFCFEGIVITTTFFHRNFIRVFLVLYAASKSFFPAFWLFYIV